MSYYYEVYIPNETEPRIYSAVRKLRGLPEGTVIWRTSEDDRYPVPVANGKAVVPSKRRANKACSGQKRAGSTLWAFSTPSRFCH